MSYYDSITEALKRGGDIRVSFDGRHLAWEVDHWTVWLNAENGPRTLVNTPDEGEAINWLLDITTGEQTGF